MLRGFFRLWMSMLFLSVVADEGGGGEVDFIIDEPDAVEPAKKPEVQPTVPVKAELDDETKSKLDALEAFKHEAEVKAAITTAVDGIKADYPDFDIEKISALLQEMHKTDKDKAERYNTPAGWEALHLKHFAKGEEEGSFDPGRKNADEPFEFEKTQKTALSGDKRAMKKLFENAK